MTGELTYIDGKMNAQRKSSWAYFGKYRKNLTFETRYYEYD